MNTTRLESVMTTLKEITDEFASTPPFTGVRESIRKLRIPTFEWPSLRIGEKVAKIPVIQGGMGVGISLSGLASAVARAGGIGVIAAKGIGLLERDYFKDGRAAGLRAFRREIRAAREKATGLLGVNIMVAVNDFHQLLDVAIEEKVDLVLMGAGLPVKGIPVERMRENGVKAVPIVSSARAVEMIFRMWKKTHGDVPDAVVCEGPLAGGHLGFSEEQIADPDFQLEVIIPPIVEALKPFEQEFGRKIPVIAAGGIFTGQDIHDAMKLGAAGVQMGTRFVATNECDADVKFKQAYVDCTEEEIGLIKSPVGMPGRAIRNEFILASEEGRRPSFRCAWQCLASCKAEAAKYCISIALNYARKGKLDKGFVFVGANAHRVKEIVPVASLVNELAEGYRVSALEFALPRLDGVVTGIEELRRQYHRLTSRVKKLGESYANALTSRIRDARDSGIDQVRSQYDAVLAKARDLQFQIVERLAEIGAALNPRAT